MGAISSKEMAEELTRLERELSEMPSIADLLVERRQAENSVDEFRQRLGALEEQLDEAISAAQVRRIERQKEAVEKDFRAAERALANIARKVEEVTKRERELRTAIAGVRSLQNHGAGMWRGASIIRGF